MYRFEAEEAREALFQSFTKELYEHFEDDDEADSLLVPSKKDFLKFVSNFIDNIPKVESTRKSSGGRISTVPGAPFNQDLCRCRVWNKGFAKQCSSKKINGEYCKMHFSKIDEYGGWSYGNYDEKKPQKQLCDGAGKTQKGDNINWKSEGSLPIKKEISQEVQDLKKEYEQKLGKKPSGPKTNDAEWLQKKIDEYESDDSEKEEDRKKKKKSSKKKISQEVQNLKKEYEKKLGKKPSGPKTNDAEWLQKKIDEYDSNSDSEKKENDSDSEKKENDSDSEKMEKKEKKEKKGKNDSDSDSDEDPKSGIKPLELDLDDSFTEFVYEGVKYSIKKEDGKWTVYDNETENDKMGNMSSDGKSIIWNDECYEEIHKDHDDYNAEDSE